MIVAMRQDARAVGAKMLAEQLSGYPLILLPQDVVVEVLEELELDRFAEAFGGLDPVDDDPPCTPEEVFVEEVNRLA
jgi:hypothetical protein